MKSPLLGGAGEYRSRNLAYNRCINLYPETVPTKDGREAGALLGCPGLALFATVGAGPIRGAYAATDGRLYVVSGNKWYAVNAAASLVSTLGTLATSTGPVSMVDNTTQVQVVDGVNAYVWTFASSVFTTVALPATGPLISCYQDGFGLLNQLGTFTFWQSNLNDLTTYNALNFSSADSTPDPVVAMADIHREVWLFKQRVTEVWVNGGLSGFAFQRLQGVQLPAGCAAAYSVARVGDSLVWLGQDVLGQGVVYMNRGYEARRISTPGVEFAIEEMSAIADAIAYTYQQEGHVFYVLTFPTGDQTWVYDATENLWHERAAFSNGAFHRHAGSCHAFFAGQHIIGDAALGLLYTASLDTYTDNGAARKWLRTWRALPPGRSTMDPVRVSALQIGMQTGIGVPDGTAPQYMLRWSDDGGHNWSNEVWADGNKPGATGARVKFRRLGQTRRGQGLDRMFELSSVDAAPVALLAAEVDLSPA